MKGKLMSCFKKPLSPPLKKLSRNYFHFMYRDFFKKKSKNKKQEEKKTPTATTKKRHIKLTGKFGELASLFTFNTLILPLMYLALLVKLLSILKVAVKKNNNNKFG